MKKHIIPAIILISALALSSCSDTAGKAVEQGKLAIANSDYQSALNSLQLAKDEGAKGDELDTMIAILENYISAKDAFESGNIALAAEFFGKIPSEYSKYTINKDIDSLKKDIDEKKKNSDDIDSQISTAKTLTANGSYDGARKIINELYAKPLSEAQKKEVDEINMTVTSAQNQITSAAEKEPEIVYITQDSGANNTKSENNTVSATYYVVNCDEYITLRNSPSTSAGEITKIPLGKAVGYIENAGNGFYKINYNGAVGYALASYLSPKKQSSGTRTARVVNAESFITLRNSPSTSADEIIKIPAGASVTYLGNASDDFYKISYNGLVGYGLKSYLSVEN